MERINSANVNLDIGFKTAKTFSDFHHRQHQTQWKRSPTTSLHSRSPPQSQGYILIIGTKHYFRRHPTI